MGKSWRIVSYIGFLTVKRNSREASVEDLLVRQSVGGGRSWDVRFQREWKAFSWRVLSWSRCEESVHTYWMDFDYHSYETSGSLIDSVDVLNFKIWSLILYSLFLGYAFLYTLCTWVVPSIWHFLIYHFYLFEDYYWGAWHLFFFYPRLNNYLSDILNLKLEGF